MVMDEKSADHHIYYKSLRGERERLYQIFKANHQIVWRHFTQNHKCEPAGDAARKIRGTPKSVSFILWRP